MMLSQNMFFGFFRKFILQKVFFAMIADFFYKKKAGNLLSFLPAFL